MFVRITKKTSFPGFGFPGGWNMALSRGKIGLSKKTVLGGSCLGGCDMLSRNQRPKWKSRFTCPASSPGAIRVQALERMKILKGFTRNTTAKVQEVRKDFEPLRPVVRFLGLLFSLVITPIAGGWQIYPPFAVALAIYGIAAIAFIYDVPVISALKGPGGDAGTVLPRQFLLVFSTGASIFLFIVAILGDESSQPSFFAGAAGIVALLAARGEYATSGNGRPLLAVLADTLIEPLLIFTAIAGVYAIPALLLGHAIQTGGITLGLLESLDRFGLYGARLFDHLHFSAVLAFGIAAFFCRHWLEYVRTRRKTPTPKEALSIFSRRMKTTIIVATTVLSFAWLFFGYLDDISSMAEALAVPGFGIVALLLYWHWRAFPIAMKRTTGSALAALSIAWFSYLAVHQDRSQAVTGLRDFEQRYTQFQDKVNERLEPVFHRELMLNIWKRLDERDQQEIKQATANRLAFHELDDAYQTLVHLGLDDRQTGATIYAMRPPDFPKEPHLPRGSGETGALPASLRDVWLHAVRFVNVVEFPSKAATPVFSEEVREMDAAVGTDLIDTVIDSANHRRLVEWLSIHFPGLDGILNSIADTNGTQVADAMLHARDQVMRRNLESPRSALDDLIAEETRSAGTHLSLHQLLPGARSASIAAERGSIQKAEAALRLEAPKVVRSAIEASKSKSDDMALQMKMLEERYPFLNLTTPGHVPSKQWEFYALHFTQAQEDELRDLEKIGPFADSESIDQLHRQREAEQILENRLAEVAGAEQVELEEMKTILGKREFDRYLKIYEARSKERYQAGGYFLICTCPTTKPPIPATICCCVLAERSLVH